LPPPPPAWIRNDIPIKVVDGNKSIEYVANTRSEPFLCDSVWYVTIKYALSCEQRDVECSRCIEMNLEGRSLRRRAPQDKKPESKKQKIKVESKCNFKKAPGSRVERVEEIPASVVDLTGSENEEERSLASFSLSGVDDFDVPVSAANEDMTSLSVARMPPPGEYDGDDDEENDSLIDSFHPVTPSPRKKARFGSAYPVSDELVDTDESDDNNDMNKKPAARDLLVEEAIQLVERIEDTDEGSDMNKKLAAHDLLEEGDESISTGESDEEESDEDAAWENTQQQQAKKREKCKKQFEAAKMALSNLSYSTEEVENVLRDIGPPYTSLQTAALKIQQKQNKGASEDQLELFEVQIGMIIRKPFDGTIYEGVVLCEVEEEVKKAGVTVKVWRVVFEDGDEEDLEYDELLRFRDPLPDISKCRGRAMQCLELFCVRPSCLYVHQM